MKYETANKVVTASGITAISSLVACLLAGIWGLPIIVVKALLTVFGVSLVTMSSIMMKE